MAGNTPPPKKKIAKPLSYLLIRARERVNTRAGGAARCLPRASLLGNSVMTGSVTFYLTMKCALSCSLYTEFGYLLLWEHGIASSWLQMFAMHNVRVKSSTVAARYSM